MGLEALAHAGTGVGMSTAAPLGSALAQAQRFAPGALVVLLVALLAAIVLALVLQRRRRRELRALLQALEDVGAGNTPRAVFVSDASPLAALADSVARIGARASDDAERSQLAGDRRDRVLEAAEPCPFFVADAEREIRAFSRGAAELLGFEESEILGQPLDRLFEPQALRELLPRLTRRAIGRGPLELRSVLVRHDGARLPAELSVRRLADASGATTGFSFLARDATESALAEARLRDSERLHRDLVDGVGGAIVLVQSGVVVHANPAFAELRGTERGALAGRRLREAFAAADVLLVEERVAAVEAGKIGRASFEASIVGPDGAPRAVVRVEATRSEHAGGPAAIVLLTDASAESAAVALLRRNAEGLDAAVEGLDAGILVARGTGDEARVEVTNAAFGRMVGLEPREILGARLAVLAPRLQRKPGLGAALAELLEDAASEGLRRTISTGEGESERRFEIDRRPLDTPGSFDLAQGARGGRSRGFLVSCRDVTARRRSELELERFAERLQLRLVELERARETLEAEQRRAVARTEELERANAELSALGEMKSKLLGNVSHELQTPLVSVRGYTEIILRERLGAINEEQRKGLELALRNVDRLISMIDSLLAFSRHESALGRLELTSFELRPLVREAFELLARPIAERRIECVERIPDGLEVFADHDKVLEVLVNLISNAVKYNRENGRVAVGIGSASEGRIAVRVEDTGVGIAADQLERIFERHYRASESAGRVPGSGLGLSIVRDILRLHGCRIYVESSPGEGSTFTFELPTRSATRDEPAPQRPQGDGATGNGPTSRGPARYRISGGSPSEGG